MRTPRVIVYTCIVVMVDKKALKNTNTHYIHTTGDRTENRGERTTRKPKKTKKQTQGTGKGSNTNNRAEKKIAVRLFDIACSTRETEERREKVR